MRRHLTVQANLYTCLNLVLSFDKGIQKYIRMDDGFAVISHEHVPLVDNFGEGHQT